MAILRAGDPMDATDTLNIEKFEDLLCYLRRNGRLSGPGTPAFTRLGGGVSNRTVRVDCPDGRAFVVKQALPKLRVATDWFSHPRRIRQEALGLIWLERLAPPGATPSLLFEDPSQHLLGMQAVPLPHANWKTRLLQGRLERHHVEQFATLLATIHRRSWEAVHPGKPRAKSSKQNLHPAGVRPPGGLFQSGLAPDPGHGNSGPQSSRPPMATADLAKAFDDRSFFESLRVEPYYRYTASRHPDTKRFFAELIAETLEARVALTHGDYSPKNILVYQDHLVLLDHEVIHFGDPSFDLGFSLTHLLSKAHHLPRHRGDFLSAAQIYWQSYCRAAGHLTRTAGFESRATRHTLGCLLARVDGRSPLEYLSAPERARQRRTVLGLIPTPPPSIPELIAAFGHTLERHSGR